MYKFIYRIGLASALLFALAGCESNKSLVGAYFDLDTDLKIEFIAEADINPDDAGVASPVFIRLYELKSEKMVKRASFIDLYEQGPKALGADLVAEMRQLKRFKPGETREENFVLSKETFYIALFAEFLDYKESEFKLVIPVVANNVFRNTAKVRISGNRLELADKQATPDPAQQSEKQQ
jgi:type VI secretion system protein VasD